MATMYKGSPLRFVVKRFLYGLAFVVVFPLILAEWCARALYKRDVFFPTHAQILSLVPGKTGSFLRNAYYYATLASCNLDCSLPLGTRFTHSSARLGKRIYLGFDCIIGQATIGDDTMLADRVSVISGRYQHGTAVGDVTFQQQEQRRETVTIGVNCWIGTGAIVMADVGSNVIIGAGSVVTKPIEDGCVAVGNPCRPIRRQGETPPR